MLQLVIVGASAQRDPVKHELLISSKVFLQPGHPVVCVGFCSSLQPALPSSQLPHPCYQLFPLLSVRRRPQCVVIIGGLQWKEAR